jgi:DNA polymerase I-like protein with 3'-5' exonuclease and polymerase domains
MTINPNTNEAYKLFHDGTLALARAERQGLRVDMDYIERKKVQLTNKIQYLEEEFKDTQFFREWQKSSSVKVNINSSDQLGKFLYKVKGVEINKSTKSGQGSTDEEALKQLDIPELLNLIKISKLMKIRDTYLDGFAREQVNGYLHPFFNLQTVVTFRSSSDSPNFQNIPKRDKETMKICRKALFSRPEHQLVEFDFSGAEVRVAACYHKDPTMIKYIEDPTTDMHGDLATQLFLIEDFNKKDPDHYRLRQAAKNGFVFPQFYGSYWKNCASNLVVEWGKLPVSGKWKKGQGIPLPNGGFLSDHLISKGFKELGSASRIGATGYMKHVKEIEDDFWKVRFPQYAEWKDKWYAEYQRKGYIDFYTGFRASGLMKKTDVTNYPVQGSSFHCLLWSLIQLDKFIIKNNLDSKIIGQIHDSIVVDMNIDEFDLIARKIEDIVCCQLPDTWKWIIVPIEMEVDEYIINGSWADQIKQ